MPVRNNTSFKLAEHLDRDAIAASIGSVGDALDNALMESTIGLYKTELIKPQRPWRTLSEVELATAEWVDWSTKRTAPVDHLGRRGRTSTTRPSSPRCGGCT
jgi:transposase InsO family protein